MEALLPDVPHVHPVNGNRTGGHVIKPGDQLAKGALAPAGGAHNGNGLPGLHIQGYVVEHGKIPVIGKAHMVDLDGALNILKVLGAFCILNGGLRAHDLYKAVEPRKAVGKELGKGGELPHGGHEGGNIEAEGQQVPVVHFALQDHKPTQGDDHHVQ